ncbi:hypothetical protein GSI_08963 [Ganoderma sinense ZZ0214-1]|uniref:MYND-type domain-containing protein n=1 Tax=Ganoderma sinense ZZ0214-1 TaxID=1077348 RepID=A0A2G8S5A3_9APHY|nr:hypothetical protein GSI_08963 [Ganoderma sinense ZZ0214-1]
MEWTLNRSETLQVLQCMGIELPADTKLLDDVLEKRLRDALNAAQYKDRLPSPFDISDLSPWPAPKSAERRSLFDAVQRGSFQESRQIFAKKLAGGSAVPELYVDPFTDLRQTMMGIGKWLDQGLRWCVLQDREREHCAVNMRILDILEVDEKTPAIVVLYRSFDKSTAEIGINWLKEQVATNPPEIGKALLNVNATPLEQRLLLKLLAWNASLVPSSYEVERRHGEESFKVSVLLPIGPLEYNALSKLNANQGCAVCGKRAASRCAGCHSISYCGQGAPPYLPSPLKPRNKLTFSFYFAACQRAHWPEHKATCRSLKGGTWRTVRLRTSVPGMEGMYMAHFNNRTSTAFGLQGGGGKPTFQQVDESAPPPPNVYGDRPFLVKLQIGLGGSGMAENMMVYDRKRTAQAFVCLEDDAWAFGELVKEMKGPRGGHGGVKMYRWARRVSDWELSVCLDRAPGAAETRW